MPSTWDATFLTEPADGDSPSSGDDEIRVVRSAITERIANEHTTYVVDGTGGNYRLDWNHRAGSAKGYFQNTVPINRPNDATALSAADNGRLWFDDNDGDLAYVYVHPNWVGLNIVQPRFSIQGALATGSDVVPRIIFPHGGVILRVDASVITAPTDADLRIDLEKNGTDSIFDTNDYVQIADGSTEGNSTDMEGTHSVLAAGDYLTVDIDQVGSTVAGADLSVSIEIRLGA